MIRRFDNLCRGLETGEAPLLDQVTPTTAALLRWWFHLARPRARAAPGFDEAQRSAILRTIVAHEVPTAQAKPAARLHRVSMPAGEDRLPVLLALVVWQLLNHTDARASHSDDLRFTRHFMAVAHHPVAHDRLLRAFCGRPLSGGQGARDFGTSDLVQLAVLLVPAERRDEVFAFACAGVCSGTDVGRMAPADGVVAIPHGPLDALEWLARLPDLMVFDNALHQNDPSHAEGVSQAAWRQHLQGIASAAQGRCVQVVFSEDNAATADATRPG